MADQYDVFISYRWVDPEMSWVRESLTPALQAAGVRTLLDVEDFVPGRDLILEMDRAGRESRRVLCILTPAYFEGDRMVSFESLAARRKNPSGTDSRLIPFLLRPTNMPDWIRGLIPIDWTDNRGRPREWAKLLKLLEASKGSTAPPGVSESVANQREPKDAAPPTTPTAGTVRSGHFEAHLTSENRGNVLRYTLSNEHGKLTYRDVLDLWRGDTQFTDFYISLFKKCGFSSYVWETPPVSFNTLDHAFEFVLCNTPAASQLPDRDTYSSYFDTSESTDGVVAFNNLGGDALLVTPSPMRATADYSNFTAFFRESPLSQQRGLWRELSKHIRARISDQPIWVSVAAGGISWLHVRLDSTPKYYRYATYSGL